jgi:hypothetical protein
MPDNRPSARSFLVSDVAISLSSSGQIERIHIEESRFTVGGAAQNERWRCAPNIRPSPENAHITGDLCHDIWESLDLHSKQNA